jgi:hypothetical protein
MCLIAREADIDCLYDNLKKQWHSLDDLTGKDFLFMFAGKCKDQHRDPHIYHSVKYGAYGRRNDNYALVNEHISIINGGERLSLNVKKDERKAHWHGRYESDMPYNFNEREERAHFTEDLPITQTKAINDLKIHFRLDEYDVPCIVFTNLYNGKNTILRFDTNNLYTLVKAVCTELEKLFSTIDSLAEELRMYKRLKQSRHIDNYINIQRLDKELRDLAEMLVEEHKVKLLECIESLSCDNGLFCALICNALNSYIRLSEDNKGVNTEMIERIIRLEEPERSQRNLKRLYERADEIIDSFNTV